MPYKIGHVICALLAAGLLLAAPALPRGFYALPPTVPPAEYGNLLIDRLSSQSGMPPVFFSHWSHRINYTCEVCHTELEFNMKTGTTPMTEAEHRNGVYCGACHDGRTAFSHEEDCFLCHTGTRDSYTEKFTETFNKKPYPTTSFGNGIDWVQALRRGIISPIRFLKEKPFGMVLDKTLDLRAEMDRIPPAIFPHKAHNQWMACDTCHPYLFNIQKKTTKHFTMSAILEGRFCGACHLNVAFPIDDCDRCHPGIRIGR